MGTELEQAGLQVCSNIGPKQRRLRERFGKKILKISGATALIMLALRLDRRWRALLVAPLSVGFGALIEAREQTCVTLALRGTQNFDTHRNPTQGIPVADDLLKRQLRLRALKLSAKTAAAALAVTGLFVALPGGKRS